MSDKNTDAAALLKQRDADEKEIQAMVASGLDRTQAEAALKHKKDFATSFAKQQAEATAAAAKAK